MLRFGNAKLYRNGSYYKVIVFAGPREADSTDGEAYVEFGETHTSWAYFKESLLVPSAESPVFELTGSDRIRKTANGFEEWITKKCRAAKKQFSKDRWTTIVAGPEPFSQQEQAVIEARRKFRWKHVGIAENGDLQFAVRNGSEIVLPYLTIGIRHKNGQSIGGVWLDVSRIRPGATAIIEKDCYKQWNSPSDVDPFEEPDPQPGDRDLYWEFRSLGHSTVDI